MRWRVRLAASLLAVGLSAGLSVGLARPAAAAQLDGISMPDTVTLGGTTLYLNGIGLRTYSWLGVRIYIAGLYLEHPSHDAEAILNSPEKKMLLVHFLHDVDAENARKAWQDGFDQNCLAPCHLEPADVQRFLAAVPPMQAGETSTLSFSGGTLDIMLGGRSMGRITDPVFSRAVLATFIGPEPPTPRVKRELLGLGN